MSLEESAEDLVDSLKTIRELGYLLTIQMVTSGYTVAATYVMPNAECTVTHFGTDLMRAVVDLKDKVLATEVAIREKRTA